MNNSRVLYRSRSTPTHTPASDASMTEDGDSEQQEQPPQATSPQEPKRSFRFTQYQSERELPLIAGLIEKELSEPYLVYTYRFFLNQWPSLCWLAWDESSGEAVGVVVCKVDRHLKGERKMRGYIAMLSVRPDRRGAGIGACRRIKRPWQ